jgi:E1A/CREB-binding protein
LNYCQANHFQFDELRRAKHSTMMVLFQLHNPSAPMFLQQCGACYRDITHGTRYHCKDCSNFDLCQDCYEPVTTGLWAKRDSRFTHNKRHTFVAIDMEAPAISQKSRDERTKAIKLHLELLSHAATCDGPPGCSLNNCQRMKKLFDHVKSCEVTYRKGCKICLRLLSLLTMHARMCTVRGACPLPFCDRIRERNKRRKLQQQLMDDRRRQAQNELYARRGAPA